MDGVQLAARFSIATNRRQYCGPADAEPRLYAAITDGRDLAAARRDLARFEALMPYLEAIARKHGLDPFDRKVVEAYWIGNELLDTFERSDFLELLEALVRRGLPRSVERRLAEHLPDAPIPHHVFHVAFVGVGAVTGHVPTTLPNMEACRPSWGRVVRRAEGELLLDAPSLRIDGGALRLGSVRSVRLPDDPKVLAEVAPGDSVAFHWGCAALRLEPGQLDALRHYTERSIAAANEALPRLHILG
ncbi:MAG: DUF6390 family protein [Thermoplasmata archaeon]|nr:DUF6390 family protein [Thermoplasmata archaeon]